MVEVKLSSFAVKSPRRFGDCWAATQLWEGLGLHTFWRNALADDAGDVPWDKVLELLAVNRLLAPRSEVFPGNRLDRTTLEHILDTIEKKFGKARRLWVFDRGIVSDDNLELLRQRGAPYLVGTPKSRLKAYEQKTPRRQLAEHLRRSAGATHS